MVKNRTKDAVELWFCDNASLLVKQEAHEGGVQNHEQDSAEERHQEPHNEKHNEAGNDRVCRKEKEQRVNNACASMHFTQW